MSVTAPRGFRAAGLAAGIKESGSPDLAVVLNDRPSNAAAGVFTANRVKAAPVLWTQQVIRGGRVRGVVLNSGGANACTGPAGFQDAHRTAERLAEAIGGSAADMALGSTGLMGERLPMDKLLPGVDALVAAARADGGAAAADAIRTTDTVAKTVQLQGPGYTIGGVAKGAGMLAPPPAPPPISTRRCEWPYAAHSTGSTLTAACPRTTPSCCWPVPRRRYQPIPAISPN